MYEDNWIAKEMYKLYGEYLENLKKPYPEELLEEEKNLYDKS